MPKNIVTAENNQTEEKPKVKRGRRTKKEIEEAKLAQEKAEKEKGENIIIVAEEQEKPVPKKRGRKPKGGKIVSEQEEKPPVANIKPNVILHLKCFLRDLESTGNHEPDFSHANVNSYDEGGLPYHVIANSSSINNLSSYEQVLTESDTAANIIRTTNDNNCHTEKVQLQKQNETHVNENVSMKETWRKLKNLEQFLHLNSVPDSKSACFWCTYDFDNPPIYIPKFLLKNTYQVYGCFCSPECACGYLMNETIDSSCKFERYSLLNNLYNKVFDYKKNIKPAPDPHYFLERFCGNLNINEYRQILKSDRLFLVVDKPLTRILPELHEDNDEFIINNKIIPTANNYNLKKKARVDQSKINTKDTSGETKSDINYGIFSMVK